MLFVLLVIFIIIPHINSANNLKTHFGFFFVVC